MKNKSFAKKFLKAYIACAVVTMNVVSIGSFFNFVLRQKLVVSRSIRFYSSDSWITCRDD